MLDDADYGDFGDFGSKYIKTQKLSRKLKNF